MNKRKQKIRHKRKKRKHTWASDPSFGPSGDTPLCGPTPHNCARGHLISGAQLSDARPSAHASLSPIGRCRMGPLVYIPHARAVSTLH
jgi:hypothetical protein